MLGTEEIPEFLICCYLEEIDIGQGEIMFIH